MKKSLLLAGGAVLASVILSGCAGVSVNQGAPGAVSMGPNFYSEYSANSMISPYTGAYTVVKRDVKASAELKSFFTCITMGDISYETLKAKALAQAPGAQDLIEVKMDYKVNTILGVNTVTANMTATAVKYK
ncbi:MAG: hypothetical protein MR727_09450 [Lentisphaeria bacterium]|nr:hypothetical protein [Lentisphaeria bacterium]